MSDHYKGTGVWMRSGAIVDLARPEAGPFLIEDIAQRLSITYRYGGSTKFTYSVAQHSIIMSRWLEAELDYEPSVWMAALLHDAAEAYVGDMGRGVKNFLKTISVSGRCLPFNPVLPEDVSQMDPHVSAAQIIEDIEHQLTHYIFVRFGVDPLLAHHDKVIEADQRVCLDEMNALFEAGYPESEKRGRDPLEVVIHDLDDSHVEKEFLDRFAEIGDRIQEVLQKIW